MSSGNEQMRRLMKRFEEHPTVQAMRHRFDFQAAMVIETHGAVDYITARDYVRSKQMCGRVRPQPNKRDDDVRWFFEFEADAVLFRMKFSTDPPRRLP